MKIHDIPGTNLFVQKLFWLDRKPWPLVSREPVQEIEHPYRHGSALAFRAPWLKPALVLGRWEGRHHEREGLLAAMGGRISWDNGLDINELEYIE